MAFLGWCNVVICYDWELLSCCVDVYVVVFWSQWQVIWINSFFRTNSNSDRVCKGIYTKSCEINQFCKVTILWGGGCPKLLHVYIVQPSKIWSHNSISTVCFSHLTALCINVYVCNAVCFSTAVLLSSCVRAELLVYHIGVVPKFNTVLLKSYEFCFEF